MPETVGIIGLGRMGLTAAKRYIEEGYTVLGRARRPEVIKAFETFGGLHATSSRELAERSDTVIVYVLNDQQVLDVVTGPESVLEGCHRNTKVICMSTIDKTTLDHIAEKCTEKGVGLVDCPVTGGPARLEKGTLTLIAAAPKDLLEACRPVLEVQGRIVHVGEKPGLGQAVKHCNQLLVGTTLAAVAEVITLARKGGLDPVMVCDIIGSGIAGSDYFRLVSSAILKNTPSPGGLGQMCKDVGLAVNDARRAKAPLVVVSAANQYFLAASSLGLEDNDSSDIIRVLEKWTA